MLNSLYLWHVMDVKKFTLQLLICLLPFGCLYPQAGNDWSNDDGVAYDEKGNALQKESPLNLPDKLELCGTEEGEIEISGKFKQIIWNTGAKTPYITVQDTGIYSVSVFDGVAWFRDSIHVVRTPELAHRATQTLLFCEGSLTKLTGNTNAKSWNWSSGSRKWGISVSQPGTYFVESSNECYSVTDTINVVKAGGYPTVLSQEIESCQRNNIPLSAFGPAENYRWNTGQATKDVVVNSGGDYYVSFKVCDSVFTQNFNVDIKARASNTLYFPNVFTPNADNVNDQFRMVGSSDNITDFQISIFNRWGVLLFKTNEPSFSWDGIFNNNIVPDGVYFYGGGYKHSCSGEKIIPIEGTITVQK